MESVADLIISQEDTVAKSELIYYLQKRKDVFFDKSVIVKSEIAKAFMAYADLPNVDKNMVLTASLLCACKKTKGPQTIEKIRAYPKESVELLSQIGFNKQFCDICLMHNRYEDAETRTVEGDILELADQMGGLILDRIDRKGYQIPEALKIIKKNMQGKSNSCINKFEEFIWSTENNYGMNDERGLNEKDTGMIGNEATGLRAVNKFDDNDIRGVLLFVQEWEVRNKLREKNEDLTI